MSGNTQDMSTPKSVKSEQFSEGEDLSHVIELKGTRTNESSSILQVE